MHFASHIGRRPVAGERARLVARSLQRVQREEPTGRTHGKGRERVRGAAACSAACPLLIPFLSPLRVSPFSPSCLHSLPSQLYMRGETDYMSLKKS
jgi:hypothetical protein